MNRTNTNPLVPGRVLASIALWLFSSAVFAQSPVVLKPNLANPGRAIPADFCGLSYEIKLVLTNANTGKYYFRSDNQPLINVFQTLGIRHLRVGGNTAERITVPIPGRRDIDTFFGFVKAAGVKAIYTVRMESNSPAASANIAQYVMSRYRDRVSCLTVGNEPDKPWKYPEYLQEWKKYTATILSPEYVPGAKFCAPSATQRGVEYARSFANDVGPWEHLAYVTQHFYPCGDGDQIPDPAGERARILSTGMYDVYQEFHDVFVPAANAKGIPYRLEESNSYGHGGAVGVSDTFTAALWIVDYLYWWAQHDALGINFHTGEKVMRGLPGPDRPNVYTAFTSSPNGYTLLPTGYGMKLFDLGRQGRLVPLAVAANPDLLNLAAYGTVADKTLRVTVINKEYGPAGRAARLTIHSGMPSARAEIIVLSAPNNDITSIGGLTIGGAGIDERGGWKGKWTRLPAADQEGSLTVALPAASAAVIRFAR